LYVYGVFAAEGELTDSEAGVQAALILSAVFKRQITDSVLSKGEFPLSLSNVIEQSGVIGAVFSTFYFFRAV